MAMKRWSCACGFAFIVALGLSLASSNCYAWWSAPVLGSSTHHKITDGAKAKIELLHDAFPTVPINEYPDMTVKYGGDISVWTSGKTDDSRAHANASERNDGPISRWRDYALTQYKLFHFSGSGDPLSSQPPGAYYYIALMAHLTEDMGVPAHAYNIPHGTPGVNMDNLEQIADGNWDNANPSIFLEDPRKNQTINYFQLKDYVIGSITSGSLWRDYYNNNGTCGLYTDPSWIVDVGAQPLDKGNYGSPGACGAGDCFNSTWLMLFDSRKDEKRAAISLLLGRSGGYVGGTLMAISKSLPPLVKDFEIAPATNPSPLIDTRNGTDISFKILENRLPDVLVSISVRNLSTNVESIANINNERWECKPVALFGNGRDLPYERTVDLMPWLGEVEYGRKLPNGTYSMKIEVIDHDGNPVPADVNAVHEFTINTTPPAKPSNLQGRAGNGSAKFAWTAPTKNEDGGLLEQGEPASYRVYYSPYFGFQNQEVRSTTTTSLELPLPNLQDGKPYFVRVTTLDSAGNESEFSDTISVTPMNAIWVHPDYGDYHKIADALNHASSGITVMVGPGEYTEPELLVGGSTTINYDPKNITLRSERGPGLTKILGNTSLVVSDGCSVIGFTIAGAGAGSTGIYAVFGSRLLIANNIFISNRVGIYSGGHVEKATDRAVRIYNNVFVGNVRYATGIAGIHDYGMVDIQNNIFRGTESDVVGIDLSYSHSVVIKYNDFYGNKSDIATQEYVPLVSQKYKWSPGFVSFSESNPLAGDFRLVQYPMAGNGVDKGAVRLQFNANHWGKTINWDRDCDGSLTDLGAYGGPFAYVDNNRPGDPGYGIPDCLEPVAQAVSMVVLKNSVDQPVTLRSRNQEEEVTFSIVSSPTGTLTGTAPDLLYTVMPDSLEPDSLSYSVSNEVGESAPSPVLISVKETNHVPQAGTQNLFLQEGKVGEVVLQGTDEDGDLLTFVLDSNPDWLTCLYLPTCYIRYSANPGESRSFSYHVNDGTADSVSAMITVLTEPSFMFLVPRASQTLITNAASVALKWVDTPSSSARVSIYANGITPENVLVENIPESDPSNTFIWDISALPDGNYPISTLVEDEWTTRQEAGGTVVIDRTPPQVSADLAEGMYSTYQIVNLSVSETAVIHCTTDGSNPTITSSICYSRLIVYDTLTLKFMAVDPAGNVGPTISKRYIIDQPPFYALLSAHHIAENQGVGVLIGNLTTIDPDPGDTFIYALVPGLQDNNSFRIVGDALQSAVGFNFEIQKTYSVVVRSTDQDGLSVENTFAITVMDANDPPTDIGLSVSSVLENMAVGTAVGTVSTADQDSADTFTYTLVSGAGSTNNSNFSIAGNVVKTATIFSYESKSTYSIRVRSTDHDGRWYEKVFAISVTDVNEAPTAIALSRVSITENLAIGTAIGTFSTWDQDIGEKFVYLLVSGMGSTNNSQFSIAENLLLSAAVLDFETKSSYSVRVRATDHGGLWIEKVFTITVTDGNDPPTDILLSANIVNDAASAGTTVGTLSTTDPNSGDSFIYSIVGGDATMFRVEGNQIKTDQILAYSVKNPFTVRIRSTDSGLLWTEKEFTVVPPSYVLWTNSTTGQALLWKVHPVTGAFRESLWISTTTGVGAGWQATSYERGDATSDYVLWTNSNTGKSTRWKVDPLTGTRFESRWLSPTTGLAAGWQASSYTYGDATTDYVLWTNNNTGKSTRWKVDRSTGENLEVVWISPTAGLGAGWQASSYERGDATTDYVLWTNGSMGLAKRWKVSTGTGVTQEDIWLSAPTGVGAGWLASSYERGDATTDYVLWTNSNTGKSTRWKVNPGTGAMTESIWISSAGLGAGWLASSYLASERIGRSVLEATVASGDGEILVRKVGSGSGTVEAGAARCGPECESMLLPYEVALDSVAAIPDAGSRFVGWETTAGHSIDILSILPGESVLAVFEQE